jgi:hypothetical protein
MIWFVRKNGVFNSKNAVFIRKTNLFIRKLEKSNIISNLRTQNSTFYPTKKSRLATGTFCSHSYSHSED